MVIQDGTFLAGQSWQEGNQIMTVSEAKAFVGKEVEVHYTDRRGDPCSAIAFLVDVQHVPMYGTSLLFDFGEVQIGRVVSMLDRKDKAA